MNAVTMDQKTTRMVAQGLGWFSLGLGIAELFAPRARRARSECATASSSFSHMDCAKWLPASACSRHKILGHG